MNVVLLQGGFSPERDISLESGLSIAKALTALGHDVFIVDPAEFTDIEKFIEEIRDVNPEIVFIGLHGAEGEDGTMQALLDLLKIRYTGSDHKASAISINKHLAASIAKVNGVSIPRAIVLDEIPKDLKKIIDFIKFPIVVKPNSSGSSVGVHIVNSEEGLLTAIRDALTIDHKILLQQYIEGKELTVGILGHETLPIVEIKPLSGFYTYENKYTTGRTEYICPAELDENQTALAKTYAETIFREAGCSAYGRVDFIFDGVDFYFLEINTLPGMREESLLPLAAKVHGFEYNYLIEKIIKISMTN